MISTLVFNIILVIAGVTGGVAIVVPVFLLINRYSHDKYRIIITMYIGLSLSILSLITYIVVYPPSNSHPTNINAVQTGVSDYTGLYIIAIVLIYVIGITVSLMAYRKGKRQYQQQVEDLDKSNERLVQDLSRRVSVDIYGPIQIQLNEMKGYYIFAKRQAIVSWIVSVACIIIGVVIMTIFVLTAFLFKSNTISLSYLTGILAAITELIGGLAFTFHSQASKKMDRYFESLKKLQDVTFAVDLLDRYSDTDKRQQALDRIVDSLIEEKSKNKEDTK